MASPELQGVMAAYSIRPIRMQLVTDNPKKPVWQIVTPAGEYFLKRMHVSEGRLRFVLAAAAHLNEGGVRTPPVVPTATGDPYASVDGSLYVLTRSVTGTEPNYGTHLETITKSLARFHRASQGFAAPAGAEEHSHLGTWPNHYNKKLNELEAFAAQARQTRGDPCAQLFLREWPHFQGQIRDCLHRLQDGRYAAWVQKVTDQGCLCHQDYAASNLRLVDGEVVVYDLDSVTHDLPARDLRKLLNKMRCNIDEDAIHRYHWLKEGDMVASSIIDPAKVAVYIRWSTEEQGQGTTLEVQRESCEHFVRSQGWTVREDLVFVDDGFSGGSLDRPAIARLRQAVKAGLVDCVVVYKLDRLSRSVIDTVNLVLQEWEGKCYIKSAREPIDTMNAAGKMFFYMLVSYAEFERSTIKERMISGKYKRAQQGRNPGHATPFGYRLVPGGKWVLDGWDEKTRCFTGPAALVRRIFDAYLAGASTVDIATKLRDEGIPSPKGSVWRFTSIYQILNNAAYTGLYSYGQRYGASKWTSKAPKVVVPGVFPPIVSKDEWDRVLQLMQARGGKPPRTLRSDYLLTGIAKCARCGAAMCGSRSMMPNRKRFIRYYVCANDIQLGCTNATINADALEHAVLAEVRAAFSPDRLAVQREVIESEIRQRIEEHAHAARALESEVAEARRKEQKLTDDYFAGRIEEAVFNRLLPKVVQDLEESTRRLQDARAALRQTEATTASLEDLTEIAAKIDVLEEMDRSELKQLLRDVIGSLTVWQDRKVRGKGSPRRNPNPLIVRLALRTEFFENVMEPLPSDSAATESHDQSQTVHSGLKASSAE